MEKKCSKCKIVKSFEEFYKDKTSKDGLQHMCKECTKARNAKYQVSHRDYFRQKGKEKYHKEDNPARYQRYRDEYLKRATEYRQSVKGRFMSLLCSAKGRAKKEGVEYDLDIDWLLDLYEHQNGCCLLTGVELQFDNSFVVKRYAPFAPSLDRIDPFKGYTKDNVRLVCTAINLAMNAFGEDFFAELAQKFLNVRENFFEVGIA